MRWEAGEVRRGPQPGRVDREEGEREDEGTGDRSRLAGRSHERAPREAGDLERSRAHAGTSSRLRPVPARPAELALRALELAKLSPLGEWHYKTASRDSFVEVSKAERLLDWRPAKSNVDTLVENYDWYVANRARMQRAGVTHRVPWNQQALAWLKKIS